MPQAGKFFDLRLGDQRPIETASSNEVVRHASGARGRAKACRMGRLALKCQATRQFQLVLESGYEGHTGSSVAVFNGRFFDGG